MGGSVEINNRLKVNVIFYSNNKFYSYLKLIAITTYKHIINLIARVCNTTSTVITNKMGIQSLEHPNFNVGGYESNNTDDPEYLYVLYLFM